MWSGKTVSLGRAIISLWLLGQATQGETRKSPKDDDYTPPVPYATSFLSRIRSAEITCLNRYTTLAPTTFSNREVTGLQYRPSIVQKILLPLNTFIHGMLDPDDSDTNEARYIISDLKELGQKADAIAKRQNYDDFQTACVATCITNQLLAYSDDIKYTTPLHTALDQGLGSCGQFSKTTMILLEEMRLDAKETPSLTHSFIKLKISGRSYFLDAQDDGRITCHFLK